MKKDILEKKIDRILLNQIKIMRNLAFGFSELRKDEILNEGLLVGLEETNKIFEEELNPKVSKKQK